MAISPTYNAYTTNTYYPGINFENTKTPAQTTPDADKTATNKTANSTQATKNASKSPYNLGNTANLSATLSEVMSGMGLSKNDPVTFRTIMQYRDTLTQSFELKTKIGLQAAGVAEDAKFQVVAGKNGGIEIISDHADKAKIVKFFEENPDLVKQFEKIQSLTEVESARKYNGFDIKGVRERIQVESMTAWFAASGQNVSSIMDFSGGETALLSTGINRLV